MKKKHTHAKKSQTKHPDTKEIAIKAENISKTFRIPHEKVSSIRGAFVSAFNRNRTYEEFKALDGVSFEVKKGEFFGIIGRNGSGKSTLLKILAGIYQPDKGRVKTHGLISPFLELGIGFNPELSGRDNIYLNATVLGLTKKEIDDKFDSIVRFSELERFIDQKLKNYSSGMQVRLAFSVSIHANRDLLLMDEVLAVGDSNFQYKCLSEFSKYRDMGRTVVLVTHDILTAQKYCDRLMLLRNGKIEMIGSPQEVGSKYIEQNMSDEDKRILAEEKARAEEEKKERERIEMNNKHLSRKAREEEDRMRKKKDEEERNRIAKITRVEYLDEKGNQKNTVMSGDAIKIRVHFDIRKDIATLNFGLAILSQDNVYVLGINTFLDKVDTREYMKNKYFEVLYPSAILGEGGYYIKAGIWGDKSENLIDFLDRSKEFRVFKKTGNEGLFQMDYKWQ